MSAVATPVQPPTPRPGVRPQPVGSPPAERASRQSAPPPALAREERGGQVLFEVPFRSAMTDADLARLARMFDLSTHIYSKLPSDPTSPGVARLDDFSGLYLQRGAVDTEWVLEARTWGQPAAESVHEWHVLAAAAAHQLDPAVAPLKRLPDRPHRIAEHPVGEVLNRRFASFRRRLVGLS